MKEESLLNNYPHRHLLGIEGLSPNSINYLLKLSEEFVEYLNKNNNENYLKNLSSEYSFELNLIEIDKNNNLIPNNLVNNIFLTNDEYINSPCIETNNNFYPYG